MGLAVVCVTSVHLFEGKPIINFDIVADGMEHPRGTNYAMDPTLTTDENLAALWRHVAAVVAEDRITLTDPSQFFAVGLPKTQAGPPLTKAEFETVKGVRMEAIVEEEQPTITARAMAGLRSIMSA